MNNIQENSLTGFTEENCLYALESLRELNQGAAMEIFKNGRRALLFIPDKMSPDKENWLERKRNSVLYFGMSTHDLNKKCEGQPSVLETKYGLDKGNYTLTPGSIPLVIHGVGLVGALSITGLLPEEDHDLAVEILRRVMEARGEK